MATSVARRNLEIPLRDFPAKGALKGEKSSLESPHHE
jgi:hypothetical protein